MGGDATMPLDVTCEECGGPFVAKTRRAKFCGAACRVRANRRPTKTGRAKAEGGTEAQVVALHPASAAPAPAPAPGEPPPPVVDAEGSFAAQVRQVLETRGALATIAGASALVLARQIDRGQDSGSAVASMVKEISRLKAEAFAEAAPLQRDGADDVMARAAEKLLRLVQ
jgi:hypothetical protein